MSSHLLSLAIWVPILGALLVLAIGSERRDARALAGAGRRRGRLPRHDPALYRLRPDAGRHAVRRTGALDPALQRQLFPRRGRHFGAVHPAQQLHHRAGGAGRLGGDRGKGGAVHGRLPDHVGPDERHLQRPRRGAVLRLLRGLADPDVHHHRRLGRAEPRLCGLQVLPLHAARLAADAGRADLPVPRSPAAASTCSTGTSCRIEHDAADPAVPRLPRRLRRQGADVAGAYLVAGRPRRGAHRRLGGAGGDHAEARRLRLPAVLAADRAGCQPVSGAADDHAVADRRDLYRLRRAGADRHEEADRLFVDLAHGFRHPRLLHLQSASASKARWCR